MGPLALSRRPRGPSTARHTHATFSPLPLPAKKPAVSRRTRSYGGGSRRGPATPRQARTTFGLFPSAQSNVGAANARLVSDGLQRLQRLHRPLMPSGSVSSWSRLVFAHS